MNFREAREILEQAYEKKMPVFIWGKPGIGKSQLVRTFANEKKIGFIDLRLSQLDAVDLRGIPKIENGETVWTIPEFLPKNGSGILFLDELNLAVPTIQHAAYELILDRKIGKYRLPDGWICVGAGNRAEDKANIFEISDPLKTRFLHIELETNLRDFNSYWNEIEGDARISSFLHFKPNYLHNQNPKVKEYTFACPRTWEFLNTLIKGETDEQKIKLYSISAIGEGVATEFVSFVKLFEKFDIKEILRNPETCEIPSEVSQLWSFVGAIANYVNLHKTKENRTNAVKIAIRLEKQPEFAAFLMRCLLEKSRGETFAKIPELNKFIERVGKYL